MATNPKPQTDLRRRFVRETEGAIRAMLALAQR